MDYLRDAGLDDLTKIYGMDRWCIVHNDLFHCCNLAIQHCSEKGLGITEKGNNRQVHHRQAMQTLHDVVISDRVKAQLICDKINQENDTKYTIKTFRERIQRWLVNGRYAKIILEGYDLVLPLEVDNFWVVWAYRYLPLVDGWRRIALEELIVFFLMPEIIVGIQFEAELVDYFDITYQWHAYPGELCSRPGFRTRSYHAILERCNRESTRKIQEDI